MIEAAVFTIGSAHAGLSGLIGAAPNTRLFPMIEEKEQALPCVAYEINESIPVAGISLDSGWYHTSVMFEARAVSAKAVKEVVLQIRAAYQRYHSAGAEVSGHKIDDIEAPGTTSEYFDPDLNCFVAEVELVFFHN